MAKGLAVQTGVSEFGSFYNYCANQASVPASVISALGRKRLPVPSASWLTSCTGAPRLERTYLKNKMASDQGAQPTSTSSFYLRVFTGTQATDILPPLPTPRDYAQKRGGQIKIKIRTTQTIWFLSHQVPLGWGRETGSTCPAISPCHWLFRQIFTILVNGSTHRVSLRPASPCVVLKERGLWKLHWEQQPLPRDDKRIALTEIEL